MILEQSGVPARHLYVVRKGAVELIAEGRLYDLLSEGEVFGQFSLLTEESPTSTVRALVITDRAFKGLLHDVPSLSPKLLASLAARLAVQD